MKHLSKRILSWLRQDIARSERPIDFSQPAVSLPERWKLPACMRQAATPVRR
jgi:hypothetical protein